MAKSIQQLREERAEKARQLRHLVDQNPGPKWKENPENQKTYDRLSTEVMDLDAEIERTQRALDLDAQAASNLGERAERNGLSPDEQAHNERTIFAKWIRGGDRALSVDECRFLAQRASQAAASLGIANTMSTGVPAEGGYTVPTELSPRFLQALKKFGGMRSVATVLGTSGGAPIAMSTTDATAEEGELLAENASSTDLDFAFGTKGLGAYKYGSKVVPVPIELLQDTAIDLEGHIFDRLAMRIARISNKHFTIGTGLNQPEGIVTASGQGKVGANGQTTSFIWEDLVDLEHSVDPAYRELGNCRYMCHDTTLRASKKLKDGQGRPLWLPGVADKEPNTLNGYQYVINQHMPVMAANAKSILFGDFSFFTIRDAMAVQFFRFTDSAYTKKGQVGFLAFSRHDSKLLDVGGAVKHYANSAA